MVIARVAPMVVVRVTGALLGEMRANPMVVKPLC